MKTKIIVITMSVAFSFSGFSQKRWELKECVDYALDHNITIKRDKLNIDLRNEDVTIYRGNFLPNLNASSGGNFNSGLSPDEKGILSNTNNLSSSFNLSARGNIFNGFRNLNSYKQAQLGVKSSQLDLLSIQEDISLNVVNEYLNILFAKENLSVAKIQYEISKKQIERARNQVEAGAKPKGELLNAESTAATDAQNLVSQENTLNLALLNLSQLLQVSPENFDVADIEVEAPSSATLYDDANDIYKKALDIRPSIAKAKLDIKNANLELKIAKAAYLPSLSYSLSMGSSYFHKFNNLLPGQSNTSFFRQAEERLQYGGYISLNIPIFNGFKTRANVTKSVINKEISEFNLENNKLRLQQIIQKAFLDAKAADKTYQSAEKSLVSQKEAYRNAQERYNFGAMTLFDFDQVRNRLVNAQSTLIRAKYDYLFKYKVLKFYSGESIFE